MAGVSLSFLFGDAGCRWMMSRLMANGVGWRGVFFFASGALAVLMIVNLILLREAPEERGLPAPEANARNVHAQKEEAPKVGAREDRAAPETETETEKDSDEESERVNIGAILRP